MRLFTSAAEPAQVPPSEFKNAITLTKPTATLAGGPWGDAIPPPTFFLAQQSLVTHTQQGPGHA